MCNDDIYIQRVLNISHMGLAIAIPWVLYEVAILYTKLEFQEASPARACRARLLAGILCMLRLTLLAATFMMQVLSCTIL